MFLIKKEKKEIPLKLQVAWMHCKQIKVVLFLCPFFKSVAA